MGTKIRSLYGVPLRSLIVTRPSVPGSISLSPADHARASGEIKAAAECLAADARFCRSLKAVAEAQRAGPFEPPVEIGLLQQVVRGFTILENYGKGAPRRDWQKSFARGTGKTWKALTEFPDRLRGLAKEIESVNRNPWYDPNAQDWTCDPGADEIERFSLLPRTLRTYADWLDEVMRSMRESVAGSYARSRRECPLWVFELSDMVKNVTGSYNDRLVVNLLDAAAEAFGKPPFFPNGSALSLAQARSRRKRQPL